MSKSRSIIKKRTPTRYIRALHWSDGDKQLHRLDGPALVLRYVRQWYKHGRLHRKDGPAIVNKRTGYEAWYFNGLLHRDDGPALLSGGYEKWYRHGKLHRVDGPAYKRPNGDYSWHENGLVHRIDGPAQSEAGQLKWFVRGCGYTEDEFYRFVDTLTGEIFLPPGYKHRIKTNPYRSLMETVWEFSSMLTVGLRPGVYTHLEEDELDKAHAQETSRAWKLKCGTITGRFVSVSLNSPSGS